MHPSILIKKTVVFQTLIDRQIQGNVNEQRNEIMSRNAIAASSLKSKSIIFALMLLSNVSYSSNGQAFDGINYINPANDLFVKKVRIDAGVITMQPKIIFNGTIDHRPNRLVSDPVIASPYAGVIFRLNPSTAFGVTVNEPFRTSFRFDYPNSPLFDAEYIRSFTLHPHFAFKATERLWIGTGVYMTNYNVKQHLVLPKNVTTDPQVLSTQFKGVGYNISGGIVYFFNKVTFLDLALFGQNLGQLWGNAQFNNKNHPLIKPSLIQTPATIAMTLTRQFMDKKLMIRLGASHTLWQNFKATSLSTEPKSFYIPFPYHNTSRYAVLARYQLTEKYAIAGYATKDYTPTPLSRGNFSLSGDILSTGLGLSKRLSNSLTITAMAAYGFNTSAVNINEIKIITSGAVKNRILFSNLEIVYNLDDAA
jgi:long-subunit fatty acid transport protein